MPGPTHSPTSSPIGRVRQGVHAFCILLGGLGGAVAQGLETPSTPASDPMRVVLVRDASPNCEPNCRMWISAEGYINASTPARFRVVLRKLGARKVPILVNSNGGSIDAALAIGRMIRARRLDVAVSHTTFVGCGPKDKGCDKVAEFDGYRGLPAGWGPAGCASACPVLFAGGSRRFAVNRYSMIGAHRASQTVQTVVRQYRISYEVRNGRKVETGRQLLSVRAVSAPRKIGLDARDEVYGRVASYLETMGVSRDFVALFFKADIDGIYWLTPDDLDATRIAERIGSIAEVFEARRGHGVAAGEAGEAGKAASAAPPVPDIDALPARPPAHPLPQVLAQGTIMVGAAKDGGAIGLDIEFVLEPGRATVGAAVFVEKDGRRLREPGLSVLIEGWNRPPLLVQRPAGKPDFAPLTTELPAKAFCDLAGVSGLGLKVRGLDGRAGSEGEVSRFLLRFPFPAAQRDGLCRPARFLDAPLL